jgi:putative glycosyltransferase (TIGR04348 family)
VRARLTAFVATPAPAGARSGNRITALRWGKRLRELGWHVRIAETWRGEPCELLVALHARRSHASIARHAELRPAEPRVVALTGTDLYGDIHTDASARASIELATRLVVLQPFGVRQLPERLRTKACTIRQSALPPREPLRIAPPDAFLACALGHLRDVKDPLLAAQAVQILPETSRIRVLHLGAALDDAWRRRAESAARAAAPRWRWLGERPRIEALRILAGADLLVLTSTQEGGANVVTEAIACGIPVLSTRIDGSLGILGDDYPGYFDVGDAPGLAAQLQRCESDPAFIGALRAHCAALRPIIDPARERESWRTLLAGIVPDSHGGAA